MGVVVTPRLPLLVELGTEELPPKALDELSRAFADGVAAGLARAGIAADGVRALASPRRLAVRIDAVETQQPDVAQERRGPALAAAFDADGKPSKALLGFAQSCGVDIAALEKLETERGAWYVYRSIRRGDTTARLLPAIVAEALKGLPVPRPMRWGARDVSFVRPAHWLVMLLGDAVVDGEVLGLKADRMSRGHRFMAPKPVWIPTPTAYVEALRSAKVIVDPDERRAAIQQAVERAADGVGGRARVTAALLDEVKNLVEWPVAITCSFDRDFLRVPQEALIMTMETNQKFFPVLDRDGRLTEHFIGIANIESRDALEVRRGYERVIRPRFADARFFFDEDLKTPLAAHQRALERVTYQQQLGSVWDKCCRVAELARVIANRVGVDGALASQAAALSKCDLMTRMVGEFPELQGTMGRYYALAQGIDPAVAAALEEHYQPRFAGDAIAASPLGRVLAVADRLDTLAGLFASGQKPTGNKDPFSLRRAALGLARTIIEGGLELDLGGQMREALDLQPNVGGTFAAGPVTSERDLAISRDDIARIESQMQRTGLDAAQKDRAHAQLLEFVFERLRGYYTDQGVRADAFDAVLALEPASLVDFDRRLRGVTEFARLPEAEALAAANKRIGNLLRQAAERGDRPAPHIDATALTEPEERTLAAMLGFHGEHAAIAVARRDYVTALKQLAGIGPAVDAFFDKVMVMADDPDVRHNRLALLDDLRRRFLSIADVGLLQSG